MLQFSETSDDTNLYVRRSRERAKHAKQNDGPEQAAACRDRRALCFVLIDDFAPDAVHHGAGASRHFLCFGLVLGQQVSDAGIFLKETLLVMECALISEECRAEPDLELLCLATYRTCTCSLIKKFARAILQFLDLTDVPCG